MKLREILKKMIMEKLLKETNQTVGRKSKDEAWISKNNDLNELISKINFPVKAFVDVSYGDCFIYVNPKNRKLLDEFMKSQGFNYHKIYKSEGVYQNPKFQHIMTADYAGGLYQIKVKNKMIVPVQ